MKDVDALIADIYEATLDGGLWSTALARAAETFGASHSLIYTPHVLPQQGGFFFSHNVTAEAITAHQTYYHPLDLWTQGHAARMGGRAGGFIGEMFVSFSELKKSEFYSDFLRPQGLHHLVTSVVHERPRMGHLVSFAMFRGPHQKAFEERHRVISERLVPHIQRALMIRERLKSLEHDHQVDSAMLDRSPIAIFLVDRAGKVLRMTEAAENLAADAAHLRLRCHHLQAVDASDRFASAIRDVVRAGGREPFSKLISLANTTNTNRIHALVVHAGPNMRAFAYVVIGPAASLDTVCLADHLRAEYRLTPAETRLCGLLREGCSIDDAADLQSIKRSTVLTQLKSIFSKTQTNRQTDLMLLLMDLSNLR